MLRIKRGVQTTFGDILWDEPFPPIYEHRDECIAAIESLRSDFDHSEEEPESDRWCAWNDKTLVTTRRTKCYIFPREWRMKRMQPHRRPRKKRAFPERSQSIR